MDLEPAITLPWLTRLRWSLVAGQLAFPVAHVLGVSLTWWPFVAAAGVVALSNLAVAAALRRARVPEAQLMGGVLILDTILLTGQLAVLGGATNPFTVFYLVYITLSAVVLSARWTTAIAALSIVGFALLFVVPAETHIHHAGPPLLNPHLQGMWAAFVLAALLTAFFVRRISRAIASQREQIATLRETAARHARLASLHTLAAGAAHELNTPLSTIAVAAHEARLRATALPGATSVAADLALILEQVDRCQLLLHQMAARASEATTAAPLPLADVLARASAQLGERAARVDLRGGAAIELALPPTQMVQSLVALINNGLEASAADARVEVEVVRDAGGVAIVVADHGPGIPAEVLAKIGEPFFTTKPPGAGLGLGVFLARVFFESQGGSLAIESRAGAGTRAIARLPL